MPRAILATNYPIYLTIDEYGEPQIAMAWSPRAPDVIRITIDLEELKRHQRVVELNRWLQHEPEPPPPWTGNRREAELTGNQ